MDALNEILEAKERLELVHLAKISELASVLGGIKVVENPALEPNEMAFMCGPELFKTLQSAKLNQ